MELIDIGANLGHESFAADLDAVLSRARAAGVARMMVTGASREGSRQALELARAHPGFLFATAGVHPHHAVEYTDECDAEMRMHAGRGVKQARMCAGDPQRVPGPFPACAGHHHLHDASGARARQHLAQVVGKTFMAQVGADVDEFHG